MTINNMDNEIEQRLLERVRQMYINSHGQEPSSDELLVFVRETLAPLLAKLKELKNP